MSLFGHIVRKRVALLGALAWIALIFTFSSQSQPVGSETASGLLGGRGDLLVHFSEYFVLALLLLLTVLTALPNQARTIHYLLVVSAAVFIGGMEEVYQGFVPDRTSSFLDVGADALGAVTSVFLVALISRYRRKRLLKVPDVKSRL